MAGRLGPFFLINCSEVSVVCALVASIVSIARNKFFLVDLLVLHTQ